MKLTKKAKANLKEKLQEELTNNLIHVYETDIFYWCAGYCPEISIRDVVDVINELRKENSGRN